MNEFNTKKFLISSALGLVALLSLFYTANAFVNRFDEINVRQSATTTTGYFVTVCLTSDTCRTTWPTGGSGTYSFTPQIIGGTEHSASTTRPFYFSQGLLTASTTQGVAVIGSLTATSSATFTNAPIFSSLTGVLKGNGASALTVAADGTDFTLITALTCTGTDKFSAVTADGTFTCSADNTGSGGGAVNPFDFNLIGGTSHAASSTRPFYFGQGLLAASTTAGVGVFGSLTATSTVDFPANSITDAMAVNTLTLDNITQITNRAISDTTGTLTVARGGTGATTLTGLLSGNGTSAFTATANGTGGNVLAMANGIPTWVATTTFSSGLTYLNGNVTADLGTSVDISAETNLTGGAGLTLTGDDMACDTASASVFGCLTSADWTTFNNKAGFGWPFAIQTIGGTIHSATSAPMYFSNGLLAASSTLGRLDVGFLNATSTTASTFTAAPIFSSLSGVLKGNGASPLTVAANGTDFTLITGTACGGTDKVSAITAGGSVTCSADQTGAGATYPFTPTTVGGTIYQATTSPLYLSGGMITGTTTIGKLTATTSADFLAGLTVTCTGCLTDVNVADIALGGGTSGNYVRTIADSGNSTITVANSGAEDADVTLNVIDVNCTNCLGATEIDETFNWTGTLDGYDGTSFFEFPRLTVGNGTYNATTSQLYLSGGAITGTSTVGTLNATSSLIVSALGTGLLKGNGSSAVTLAVDGTDFSLITALTCSGTDKFSAVTADGTFTCTTDATSAGAADPFAWATNFGTTSAATTSSMWLRGGAYYASTSATSTFEGGLSTAGLKSTNGLTITGGNLLFGNVSYSGLDGGGLTQTSGALAVGAGTCITINANDVAVTSNCTDAATVDSIEGASLLLSNASDNYTSGTLTFDAGTILSIAGTLNYTNSATSSFNGGILTSQGFDSLFISTQKFLLGDTATTTIDGVANFGGGLSVSTTTGATSVFFPAVKTTSSSYIASTTVNLSGFAAGQKLIPLPVRRFPWRLDYISCGLKTGINVVIKGVHDDDKAATNNVTCLTTGTTTQQRITTNGAFDASELGYIEIVSVSGTPDGLKIILDYLPLTQ